MRYKVQEKAKNVFLKGNHGSYGALLFDKRWKHKREKIIKRDKSACKSCGKTHTLEVHHRQYHFIKKYRKFRKPWDYDDDLLITFCKVCHKKGHQKFKVPIIYI